MGIRCKKCQSVIPKGDVDRARNLATCMRCCTVFDCHDALDATNEREGAPNEKSTGWERPRVTLPDGVILSGGGERGRDLTLRGRWAHGTAVFQYLLSGLIFASLGVVSWWLGEGDVVMIMGGAVAVVSGSVVAYIGLGRWINETRIDVAGGALTISREPLPWPRSRHEAGALLQLYSVERAKGMAAEHSPTEHFSTYEVRAMRHTGDDVTLVQDLEQAEQALFVEQQLELALGIRDRPVPHELSRER